MDVTKNEQEIIMTPRKWKKILSDETLIICAPFFIFFYHKQLGSILTLLYQTVLYKDQIH